MTRTEDRLTDALTAAVSGLREDTLRPLAGPAGRDRRWARWLAPAAAAAAVTLVVSLAAVLTGGSPALPGPGAGTSGVPRYYADMDFHGQAVVRATATGAVTGTVPIPRLAGAPDGNITAAANGTFFVAAFASQSQERIYRFEVTSAGQVSGFAPVRGGGALGSEVNAMAASPDGSRLAVATKGGQFGPARITVIDAATGRRTVWQGGLARRGFRGFDISSLSWTSDQQELVFTAQWCKPFEVNSQVCEKAATGGRRAAQVRALNPAAGGGRLDSGRLLLRQSARYPYIASAAISPDGTTITALVLHGPVRASSPGTVPDHLSVVQISAATGRRLRVLYQRLTGPTFAWQLSPDAPARQWLLDGVDVYGGGDGPRSQSRLGFNGWIGNGRLHRLQPATGYLAGEAW
jgi:hypothetical protein